MRRKWLFVAALILSLGAGAPAWAHYWKLEGPPTFAPSVNGDPAFHEGETRPSPDGEGSQVTVVERSTSSAVILSVSSRWGAHRIRYTWDAPPDILRPGQQFTTKLGWEITQKWSQFSPVMYALLHLDWSPDFYTRSLQYGWPSRPDLNELKAYDSNTWTVTTNDPGELTYYASVACGGGWVRVVWKYKRVDGDAPAGAESTPPGETSTWQVPPGNTGTEALTAPPDPVVFRNGADGSISAGVTVPTEFQINTPLLLTQIMTYHYGFRGKPGTIALRHADGTTYGPWPAAGAGSAAQPNVYWWVRPNIALKAGRYTVIDSDPASWSKEAATHGAGIVQIWGRQR